MVFLGEVWWSLGRYGGPWRGVVVFWKVWRPLERMVVFREVWWSFGQCPCLFILGPGSTLGMGPPHRVMLGAADRDVNTV